MLHYLKIDEEYYFPLVDGLKKFEVCKNDRNYQVGDILVFDFEHSCTIFHVDYILDNSEYVKDDFIIMSLSPCKLTVERSKNIDVISRDLPFADVSTSKDIPFVYW